MVVFGRNYFKVHKPMREQTNRLVNEVKVLNLLTLFNQKYLLIALIALLPIDLLGALSNTNTSSAAINPSGTTFSWSHTQAAGDDGHLVVIILSPAGPTTSTVTYNGTSMTKAATYSAQTVAVGEWTVWELDAPSTGSNTVAVTLGAGNWNTCLAAAYSFTGCDGVGNFGNNGTAATDITTSVTVSANSMIIGCSYTGDGVAAYMELPDGTDKTLDYFVVGNNDMFGAVSASLSSGATTIESGSTGSNVILGIEVLEAAAAGPNVKDNNTTNLNAAGSWTTAVPTTSEVATWESTVIGANTSALGGNTEFQGLAVDDPGGLVTISTGSTLTIGTSGIDNADATQNMTIASAVALGADQNWDVNTSKTLTASNVVSGAYKISKKSAGTLTLSGTNTFTGGVDHDAGILKIGAAAALGTTAGTLTVASGTTIDNSSGGALTTSNYPLNLRSFTFTGSNDLNFGTGATALAAATTITASANELELGGIVSGGFKMTKAGSGTLTLSGTNTFTGGVDHNAGTLNIDKAAALGTTAGTFTIADDVTINNTSGGAITTSNYPIAVTDDFIFTGSNNLNMGTGATVLSATSTITTNGSELELGGVVSGSFGIVKAGSGALTLSGTNTFTAGVTHNAGTLNIDAVAALGTTAGTLTIADGVTIDNTSGGTLKLSAYPITIADDFTYTGTNWLNLGDGAVALNANSDMTINGGQLVLNGIVSGAYNITKLGTGALRLKGANTFTGGVTLTAGTIRVDDADALGTTAGTFSIGAGTSLDNKLGSALTMSNYPITMNSFTFTGSDDLNLGSGAVALGSNTTITSSANDLTMAGIVSGAYTVTSAGSGNIFLTGTANTYTGTTTVGAGNLYFNSIANVSGGASSLGAPASAGNGTIAIGATTSAGTLIFNGSSDQTTDRVIDLAGTTGGATIDAGASNNLTFTSAFTATGVGAKTLSLLGSTTSNVISGAIVNNDGSNLTAIDKQGSGSWILAGANTYTGTTTITAGTLEVGAGSTTGSIASASVVNGAALEFNRSDALTYAGVISSSGTVEKKGGGTLTFTGANSYTGNTTITAGSIELGAAGVIADGSMVDMNGGGLITGSGAGYSETAGVLDLSNSSTFSLGTGNHTLTFAASQAEGWTAGKLLTISGWNGGYDGTGAGGSDPKIFVGSAASHLTADQLSQIGFFNGTDTYEADLLATGELVPKLSLLPVELVHFAAHEKDEMVDIEWVTASEINSDYFDVQRTGSDIIFESIGIVTAAGQSSTFEYYNFEDYDPEDGINYYKLVEYDMDGTVQESKIIEVLSLEKTTLSFIKTNGNGNAMFQLSAMEKAAGKIHVTSLNGQRVKNASILINEGGNQFVMNTSIWLPGYYVMTIVADGLEPQSIKFLVK